MRVSTTIAFILGEINTLSTFWRTGKVENWKRLQTVLHGHYIKNLRILAQALYQKNVLGQVLVCPTLAKGSKWEITQIWENDDFRLDLAYFTSIPSLEQKYSSCWKIFKSRYNDIALMLMYMTDTFCSFTREMSFSRVASFCQSTAVVVKVSKNSPGDPWRSLAWPPEGHRTEAALMWGRTPWCSLLLAGCHKKGRQQQMDDTFFIGLTVFFPLRLMVFSMLFTLILLLFTLLFWNFHQFWM